MVDAVPIADIVRAAVFAPSGDNCQPWHFSWDGQQLSIHLDRVRAESFYDVCHLASWIALGATLTNIELAAAQVGLKCHVAVFPNGHEDPVVARMTFHTAHVAPDPLIKTLPFRCVNRRPYTRNSLLTEERNAVVASVQSFEGIHLNLLEDSPRRDRVAALAARNDRVLFEHRSLHDGLYRWLRWTPEAIHQTGDGMPIAALELSPLEQPGFRLLSAWPCASLAATLGITRLLPLRTQWTYRHSSAIGLLSMTGTAPKDFVRGGAAMERLWLTSTLQGLAFQPITGMTFLWLRTQLLGGAGLSPHHRTLIEDTANELHDLLGLAQRTPVMLFRLGHATAPSARAPRRPVEHVLTSMPSGTP